MHSYPTILKVKHLTAKVKKLPHKWLTRQTKKNDQKYKSKGEKRSQLVVNTTCSVDFE
jgi:hypothetical protein